VCGENEKDEPLAATFCYFTGIPTTLLGIVFLIPTPQDVERGIPCLWGLLHLLGAGLTVLLAITSLVRREDWKLWTVLCAVSALLPIFVGLALSR